jgi:hypothetical protein
MSPRRRVHVMETGAAEVLILNSLAPQREGIRGEP